MKYPKENTQWEHITSGTIYTIICVSNTDGYKKDKFKPTVVYKNPKGRIYSREYKSFKTRFKYHGK